MSPFEHQAECNSHGPSHRLGNFSGGWRQYRKFIAGEDDFRVLQKYAAEGPISVVLDPHKQQNADQRDRTVLSAEV